MINKYGIMFRREYCGETCFLIINSEKMIAINPHTNAVAIMQRNGTSERVQNAAYAQMIIEIRNINGIITGQSKWPTNL